MISLKTTVLSPRAGRAMATKRRASKTGMHFIRIGTDERAAAGDRDSLQVSIELNLNDTTYCSMILKNFAGSLVLKVCGLVTPVRGVHGPVTSSAEYNVWQGEVGLQEICSPVGVCTAVIVG